MDDLEFLRRCLSRDKQAWDEFVNKYSRLIYNYIYSVLKVKGSLASEETVNDLFQEIFLILTQDNFKKLSSFKGKNGCTLATWLRQVTVNFTIDYLRKLKPALSLDQENDDERSLKEILADDSPLASDTFHHQEKLLHLKDCIEALEKNDQYFLELHLNRGLALEDLKEHLGISRGAIDMRKHRIIQRLRDCFKGKGFPLDF